MPFSTAVHQISAALLKPVHGECEPDGDNAGGRVVAATTPEEVVKLGTHTGVAVAGVLARGGVNFQK